MMIFTVKFQFDLYICKTSSFESRSELYIYIYIYRCIYCEKIYIYKFGNVVSSSLFLFFIISMFAFGFRLMVYIYIYIYI